MFQEIKCIEQAEGQLAHAAKISQAAKQFYSSVNDTTQLCLEYCLVITLTPATITPTAIMIYPFTVHSGLLYMNEVEGPREDLL
jgi:hypothetical protein